MAVRLPRGRLTREAPRYAGPIKRRNLIFHLCPLLRNDIWRWHVAQLRRHARIFAGRRMVAIATGPGMVPTEEVREALGAEFEVIEVPNDSQLREVASLRPLLEAVASTREDEATFYGHSKGNSTGDSVEGAMAWTATMYGQLVGRWPAAMRLLEHFAAVGTTQIVWPEGATPPYPTQQPGAVARNARLPGLWMFAGTFFWFRHAAVFSRPGWADVRPDRYAAEAWLSGLIEPHEAFSLYQPWPEELYPTPSPYHAENYPPCYKDLPQ